MEGAGAVIINPGAWTHYSYAIRDALEMVRAPVAEVHLSDIEHREEFRRHSVLADIVALRVSGKGVDGYLEAVDKLAEMALGTKRREGAPAMSDGADRLQLLLATCSQAWASTR